MKRRSAFELTAFVLSVAALLCFTEGSSAQSKAPKDAGGLSAAQGKEPTPFTADECPPATKYVGGADESTRYCILSEQRALKRCETSYFNYLKRDEASHISFEFRLPNDAWDFHDMWTSIFQIHSKPDPGEQWRCPIAMLAVRGHSLEMWDRDDLSPISVTTNGTCADAGNSIQSHDVFTNIHIEANRWYHFDLKAILSLKETGSFTVRLDDKVVGSLAGPNTFNDQHRPFAKIGIYKPSPWLDAKRLCADYRNFSIESGK
jgi:hypothetical protein